jgi:hypothetical protein
VSRGSRQEQKIIGHISSMISCSCLLLLPLFYGGYLTSDVAGFSIKAKFKEGRYVYGRQAGKQVCPSGM